MSSSKVEVRQSRTGRGVMAGQTFLPGQEVGRVSGRVINDPEYGSDYCLDLQDGTSLELAAPFRFLNHSCEPNAEMIIWEYEGPLIEVWLHALRTISRDEELTVDYGWSEDHAIPCRCGTAACRGRIVAKS